MLIMIFRFPSAKFIHLAFPIAINYTRNDLENITWDSFSKSLLGIKFCLILYWWKLLHTWVFALDVQTAMNFSTKLFRFSCARRRKKFKWICWEVSALVEKVFFWRKKENCKFAKDENNKVSSRSWGGGAAAPCEWRSILHNLLFSITLMCLYIWCLLRKK